jgi:Rha family phage regulatory protein
MASSLQVAKHFEKDHNQVLRKIRSLIKNLPEERNVCNFTPINISKDLGHAMRQDPTYLLNRDAFTLLAMKFTGKKALAWQLQYIEAFNSMEAALRQQAAGEMCHADIPPQESEEIRHGRMVKIFRALLAHWANLDNLPLETAETSLCLHLNVRRLEDCTLGDTDRAFSFLFRAQHLPVNTGEKAAEEQLDCIRLIADGCTQFRAYRDGDLYGFLKRAYGLAPEDFECLTIRSANKIIFALSGLFFTLWGNSEYLSKFENKRQLEGHNARRSNNPALQSFISGRDPGREPCAAAQPYGSHSPTGIRHEPPGRQCSW